MRIAAFDLETTDLKANMGILLCGAFQPIVEEGKYPKPQTLSLKLADSDVYDPDPDKALAVALRDKIESYHMIVSWNGKMFDIPFLNSRLMFHNERPVRPQFHLDLMWYMAGSSNRVGSRKLMSAQQFFRIPETKTSLDWEVWKRAMKGDTKAMKEVTHHCEIDVTVLAKAYWRLIPFVSTIHR